MSECTPTPERVESLGEDLQAYLVMDGVYLDHQITRNLARCILTDPDWAGIVAEEPEGGGAGAIGTGNSPRVTGHSAGPRGRQGGSEHSTKIDAPASPAEEPEWEYGEQSKFNPNTVWIVDPDSQSMIWADVPTEKRVRRRAAGEWVPVKQEGAEADG